MMALVQELTFADKRMAGKQEIPKELSPFVAACREDGAKVWSQNRQ